MNKERVLKILRCYGFIEISELVNYIEINSLEVLSGKDLEFILEKLTYCLQRHCNGSDYFRPLKTLCLLILLKK